MNFEASFFVMVVVEKRQKWHYKFRKVVQQHVSGVVENTTIY